MLLTSPDPRQKAVTIGGATFRRTAGGFFELPNVDVVVGPLLAAGWSEYQPQPVAGSITVPDEVRSAEFHAVVIRCGCGAPLSHPGQVCPRPLQVENLGKVAAFYRNPWKALAWKIAQAFRTLKPKPI